MDYRDSKAIREFELQKFPAFFPPFLLPFVQFKFIYVAISSLYKSES